LKAEAMALQRLFYFQDELDEPRWLSLIQQLERSNRPHAAIEVRLHLEHFKKLLEEYEADP
jgi:hypothetical protein